MLRKLSEEEYWMAQASEAGPLQFSTTARVRGDFTSEELQAALAKVRQRHPLLAVRMAPGADGQLYLTQEGVPDFPLRIVERAQEDEWIALLTEELLRPFTWETGPLVRFAWLRGDGWSDLIAFSHHAISDGLSGAYLMRDLLYHLGDPAAPVEPLPLLPPIYEMIPPEVKATLATMSIPDLLEMSPFGAPDRESGAAARLLMRGFFALLQSPLGPFIGRWMERAAARKPARPPVAQPSTAQAAFCLSAWSLDAAQTAALVARAREEGTTVHAALGAAFLRAFAEVIGGGEWQRMIQSPVNLRQQLSPPVGEDFGMFITLAKTTVDCRPARDFWEIARDIKAGFRRATTPERLFAMYGLMKAFAALPTGVTAGMFDDEEAFSSAEYDLSLSNIGRLDIPTTYGSLILESLYGPTFSAVGDRIVGVNTTGGRMCFTFIFQDTLMDAVTGERVRELALRRLREAL